MKLQTMRLSDLSHFVGIFYGQDSTTSTAFGNDTNQKTFKELINTSKRNRSLKSWKKKIKKGSSSFLKNANEDLNVVIQTWDNLIIYANRKIFSLHMKPVTENIIDWGQLQVLMYT